MDDEELKGLIATPAIEVEEPRVEEPPSAPEAEAAAPPEESDKPGGPPRGPDGKFVPKAADTPAGHVPLSALLDEREKRRAAEQARAELEARAAPATPPEPAEELRQALYAQNLRSSRRFAEKEYGADTIAQVHDWARTKCDADPHFNQLMRTSDDPYEAAYQAYAREQVLAEVKPSDLEAFKAWRASQAAGSAAPPPQPTPTPPAPLPKSLATAPGNGAAGKVHTPTGPGEAFNAVIGR